MDWIPLIRVSERSWVGTLGEAIWVGNELEAEREVHLDRPVFLLPLLERGREQVLHDIQRKEEELSLPDEYLNDHMQVDYIAVFSCTTMTSDYWASLGIAWMCAKGFLMDEEVQALQEVSVASWASQKLRHMSGKLIHQLHPRCAHCGRRYMMS